MRFPSFIGGSYQSQSILADCSRTCNWYVEVMEDQGATAKAALYPTPGVRTMSTYPLGNGRGHFAMAGREFAIIGTAFLEINGGGQTTSRGTVALDSNPATFSSNGDLANQLFITSGGNGYIFALDTNTLTQITALNGKATMGGYLDGYFLALDADANIFYFSNLADGLTWTTGIDFAQRSLAPDPWLAMKIVGRYIWLLGERTSEVWFDTGQTFPFAPAPSGFLSYGIAAPFSVAIIGQDPIWLAQTDTGRQCVVKCQGFTPQVISTQPLETAFEGYNALGAAVGDCYSDRGHTFYLLSFDRSDITWAWDLQTGLWCERGTWIAAQNKFTSWRPRFYAWAFNQHRMLDAAGGSVFQLSSNFTTDVDGLYIRRVRRAPAINDELKRVFYSCFELDLEPGLGDARPTIANFTAEAAAIVTGTVTYDDVGGPFIWVGATVTMTVDGTPWTTTATTDGSGVYSFGGVPAGTIGVEVTGNPGPGTRYGLNGGTAAPPATLTLDILAQAP